MLLTVAALAVAVVGMTMNGWFSRSLGSTDTAGWLFLTIGVAADLVALVIPSLCRQPLAGRTAGHGAGRMGGVADDVCLCGDGVDRIRIPQHRGRDTVARVTCDTGRDGGAGRPWRCDDGAGPRMPWRRREVLPGTGGGSHRAAASGRCGHGGTVAATADPQTEAASRIVAWASLGAVKPSGNDFAMLRLLLLSLLPQAGGLILLVARPR